MRNTAACILALLAALVFAVSGALAVETHEGKVVTAGSGKLTMTDKDGKNEHSHDVAVDAIITMDGKECKLDDLVKDTFVTVTTEKRGDKSIAIKIEAKKNKN